MNIAQRKRALMESDPEPFMAIADGGERSTWPCWSCKEEVSMDERSGADGDCPKCGAELDLELWPNPPASQEQSQ